jgi:flagellar biosynthesis protein FlhA
VSNRTHLVLPALLVGVVICLIVPMPTIILDVLLAVNIVTALVTLSSVLNVPDPVQFSSYPSLLLVTTAARVALTVSTTRSILLHADAGEVVETFGRVVVGSNVVVGLVIFLVLTIVNLMVITKGSERASEVAARFSLDAMPGKQMAVDSDLAAGLLDEVGARAARARIAKESDFYGAMDGAVKFVKGDAMASVVVVFVNLIGGFTTGVVSRKMPIGEAAQTYALLTVGDGLVAQLPALLYALATGMLVNRVRGETSNLGGEIAKQLASSPMTLRTAAGGAIAVALIPGMPKVPFVGLAVGLFVLASRMKSTAAESVADFNDVSVTTDPDDPEVLIARMRTEPIELRLAYDCTDLVSSGDLLPRIKELRRQLATELGFVLPHVVTSEDATLQPGEYRIAIWGVDVGNGRVPQGGVLALPDPSMLDEATLAVLGERVVEPVFGLVGYWIPEADRGTAAAAGATLVPRSAAIVTHVAELARRYAPDLLSRQHVADLIEALRMDQPLLANEIGADRLPMTTLHQVLRSLLSERVAIRDLPRIVETLSVAAGETRNPEMLADECRTVLGAQIAAAIAPNQTVAAVLLVPELEGRLMTALRDVDGSTHLALDPELLEALRDSVRAAWERLAGGDPVVMVCAPALRRPLARVLSSADIELPVFAYRELPRHLTISVTEVVGV